MQKTEETVGPYELHDFYLYYVLRFGYEPSKIYRLAKYAFGGIYEDEIILKWLKNFIGDFSLSSLNDLVFRMDRRQEQCRFRQEATGGCRVMHV